nr:hypothetical protein [Delftia acidovorans]
MTWLSFWHGRKATGDLTSAACIPETSKNAAEAGDEFNPFMAIPSKLESHHGYISN